MHSAQSIAQVSRYKSIKSRFQVLPEEARPHNHLRRMRERAHINTHSLSIQHLDLASSTCKICMMNGNNRSYCVAIQFPFDEHFHILVVK